MGLDSAIFLLSLGCVALLQACLPARRRVAALLCASLAFYAFSSISYLIMLLALCVLNYQAAVSLKESANQRLRTWVFAGTILANLGLLIAFKFASGLLSDVSARLGWSV